MTEQSVDNHLNKNFLFFFFGGGGGGGGGLTGQITEVFQVKVLFCFLFLFFFRDHMKK